MEVAVRVHHTISSWQPLPVKRVVSIRKSRGGHAGARRDRFSAVTP